MFKKIGIYIFFSLVFLLFPQSFVEASNFDVSSNVVYTVSESGNTHAEFKVTLTNTSTQYFASQYKVHVGFEDITNVKASDRLGFITPKVSKTESGTTIEFTFNDKVVGKDKSLPFTVSFDTKDAVQNQGDIWELNIPGISKNQEFREFNVQVIVPAFLGEPTYIKPPLETYKSGNILFFTKDQLKHSSISVAYGQKQTYEFLLTYHLKNNNFFPISTDIALPPNTNYQDTYFDDISPKPSQVIQDTDGNWLATYMLSPREKVTVTAKGLIDVSLYPKRFPVKEEQLKKYLLPQKFWDAQYESIKKQAEDLKTPEAIYEYVVSTLSYDFSRVSANKPRLGGEAVLKNPSSAVCLEFTDLFISLARAAGIPAREVDGFAYTNNSLQRPLSQVKDILHAWPEYYDRELETWVMVDPTWANTSGVDYFNILDFDHVALVIRGVNSEYPIPAGGYKTSFEENKKDVHISFTKKSPTAFFDSKAEIQMPRKEMAGFPIQGAIVVWNNGNTLMSSQKITVQSEILYPKVQSFDSGDIPPFGSVVIPVSYKRTSFLTNAYDTLTITVGNKKTTHTIEVAAFALTKQSIFYGGIGSAIFVTIIFIIAIRARRI